MSIRFIVHLISVLSLAGFFTSCSERTKDNPFDPSGNEPVVLNVLSFEQTVELNWGDPDLVDYSGFNIYRREHGTEDTYKLIAENMLSTRRSFTDYNIEYYKIYSYYITVVGLNMESRPSRTVSITPGPGYIWIIDNGNFEIIKTTYDTKHIIETYNTSWPPTDMAVSSEVGAGIVLYLGYGIVEKLSLMGHFQERYEQITHPGAIAYEPVDSLFWIADTSGILYTLDSRTDEINVVSISLSQPVYIHVAPQNNIISVVDYRAKEIVQFNRSGVIVNIIRTINDRPMEGPSRFVIDEAHNRIWLIDGSGNAEYVYTRRRDEIPFIRADSVRNAGDLEVNFLDETAWFVLFNYQSSNVLQLSKEGTRQLELSGFYNPYDLEVNPYDGTLLIVDTGNDRVIHYNLSYDIIGELGNLIFPVKVVVQ